MFWSGLGASMGRFSRSFLVAGAASLFVSPCWAEAVNLLGSEYKPLVSTKSGEVELCGIHFAAVVSSLDKKLLSIQGSVNTAYFGGKIPAMMIKFSVNEVINNNAELVPRRVQFASLRVGQQNTLNLQSRQGDDGNSLLLLADINQVGEFVFTFPDEFYKGAWVSVSLDQNKSDYTFRLPAFGDADVDTVGQVAECNLLGIGRLKKELEKQK
jgi:hypothetical protein